MEKTEFRHVFKQVDELHDDFPESRETPVWYGHKFIEEVAEFNVEAHNDPNYHEWLKMAGELDDIGITLIGAYLSLGINADVALLRMGVKLLEVRRRFEIGHYNDHPRLKLPNQSREIAFSEGVDYLSDYE